jgi:anti-sigma28 factor (negative regulator of flagellin synthesis)
MKIPGKKEGQIDPAELLRLKQQQRSAEQTAQQAASESRAARSGSDSVDVGLSKAIQNLVSIEELQEEREAKKARLKELVQSGKYSVASEDVARRLGEEIAYEIYANSDNSGE